MLAPACRSAVATGTPETVEFFYPPLAARFEVRAFPSADGLSVVFRDVTARHRAEAELRVAKEAAEAADRIKDAFLRTVSHELRTP